MEFFLTLLCSFPNWCRKCSHVIIEKATNVRDVIWDQCNKRQQYEMTVKNFSGALLHESNISCCEGNIKIRYFQEKVILPTLSTRGENVLHGLTEPLHNMTTYTNRTHAEEPISPQSTIVIASVAISGILVIIVLVFVIVICRKKK
ncbi:uncharacterized protein LOC134239246 [Saccostrea cucullata]|uniref:uncharacterized protein LOC134239246 n=1 Tax=Saccostrea cuccullata TaxID=36930 RepID=UPI002ED467E7